jgi:DNA-binding PadR family transcriptional regulator
MVDRFFIARRLLGNRQWLLAGYGSERYINGLHRDGAPVNALTPITYAVLLALADEPRHGYGIIKEIESRAGRGAAPSTGALYLALQRMEAEGLIEESRARRSASDDRRRRYWALTREGRAVAKGESRRLVALLAAAREKDLIAGDPA